MKWIATILAAIVLAMPLGFAQDISAQNKADTESRISVASMRFTQIGEAFGDFIFAIKSVLTFDQDAKVELIKERNEELRERQKIWLETKADALASFESGNLSASEKKEIISTIQAEHEAIIKEHLRLNSDLKEIELKAKAEKRIDIETKARSEAAANDKADLALGLNVPIRGHLGLSLLTDDEIETEIEDENEIETEIDTEAEAQAVVEQKLGFDVTDIRTETRNGETFFIVTGSEVETTGSYRLEKEFEVVLESGSGLITSADFEAHIEAITNTTANASGQTTANSNNGPGSSSVSGSGNGGFVSSDSGISGNAGASGSVSGSASTSGSVSGSSQSSASGSAQGSSLIKIG